MIKYKILNTNNILNDGWCFAMINNHFGEIHFAKGLGIWGHAYEDKSSFKTKKEKDMIKKDLKKYNFTYRDGFYFNKINKVKTKIHDIKKDFSKSKKVYSLDKIFKKLGLPRKNLPRKNRSCELLAN